MDQAVTKNELRVLMLEDTPTDAELIERELRKAGIAFTSKCVETRDAFVRALEEFHPDIVLSDYKLPDFDGLAALEIVQRDHPEVPVVMVTGALTDIKAVELIHAGAKDYVLKDRLARLAPAIQRALAAEQSARARQAAEKALRESLTRYTTVTESANDAIICLQPDGSVELWNKMAQQMFGYSVEEAIGKQLHQLIVPERYRSQADEGMRQFGLTGTGSLVGKMIELTALRRDGTEFPIELSTSAMNIGGEWHATGIIRDITERKRSFLAQHDFLTGLPNRVLLTERISEAIGLAHRHRKQVALLSLDLDHFKHINASLGHAIGDQLLQSVANRLVSCVGAADTVCRQGSDEFVILLAEIEQPQDATHIAEKLLAAFGTPHSIGGHELLVTLSIGISVYPDDGINVDTVMQDADTDLYRAVDTMIQNADTAMYHAKARGRNNYQFFSADMNTLGGPAAVRRK